MKGQSERQLNKIVKKVIKVNNLDTAEFVKLYENIYRSVNIGLVNEMKIISNKLNKINGITVYGNAPERTSIISFNIENIHSLDIAQFLDYEGIAVRSGHHCCKPLMKKLGISSCVRISFHIYNEKDEIDTFIEKLNKSIETLS